MKHTLFIISLICFGALHTSILCAATPQESYENGCALYSKNEFRAAAMEFEKAAKTISSTDIQYNLGNCYYRLNDYARARLAFERAVQEDPSNSDAKYNLKITVAKIKYAGAQPQSFISSWWHELLRARNIAQWVSYAMVCFALMLVCVLLYFFGNALWIRKSAFFTGLAMAFIMVVSLICAGILTSRGDTPTEAIVLQQSDVRQSPSDNSKTLQHMLPGTKIKLVTESYVKGWQQVSLGGGQKGWIFSKNIGLI